MGDRRSPPVGLPAKYICFDILSTSLFINLLRGKMNKLQKYICFDILSTSLFTK